jgi:hypothetical protein
MARYTSDPAQMKHIKDISMQMPVGGPVTFVLKDGKRVSGGLRGEKSGNNWPSTPLQVYGEVKLVDQNGGYHHIDMLDIAQVITPQQAAKGSP